MKSVTAASMLAAVVAVILLAGTEALLQRRPSFARPTLSKVSNKLQPLFSDFARETPVTPSPSPEEPEESEEAEAPPAPPAQYEDNDISDAMKQKLRRELISQGADPNYSAGPIAGNPILVISGIIAILVLVGGQGFFF
jgi:hypothetical protein